LVDASILKALNCVKKRGKNVLKDKTYRKPRRRKRESSVDWI